MRGGYNSVELLKQWRDVVRALGLDAAAASNHAAMKLLYERCLLDFEHYLRTPGLLGEGGGEGWEWKGVGGGVCWRQARLPALLWGPCWSLCAHTHHSQDTPTGTGVYGL